MKKITTFENAIANRVKDIRAEGINATAFWAYRRSQDNGNDLIDFSEVIWDEDVEPIAETFKKEGIDEFTISSTFSSLREERIPHGRPYRGKRQLHRLEHQPAGENPGHPPGSHLNFHRPSKGADRLFCSYIAVLYTVLCRNLCVHYDADITCYFGQVERICVQQKERRTPK